MLELPQAPLAFDARLYELCSAAAGLALAGISLDRCYWGRSHWRRAPDGVREACPRRRPSGLGPYRRPTTATPAPATSLCDRGPPATLAAGAPWLTSLILAAAPDASFAAAQTTTTPTHESTMVTMVPATTIHSAREDELASLPLSMIFPGRAEHRHPLRCIELRTLDAEKLGRSRLGWLLAAPGQRRFQRARTGAGGFAGCRRAHARERVCCEARQPGVGQSLSNTTRQ